MVAADALHSAPPPASAPDPASLPVGMEHEAGAGRGAAGVGGGQGGGSPRASQAAAAHLVKAESWSAGLGLGGATPPAVGALRSPSYSLSPPPHQKYALVVRMDRAGDVCDLRDWKEKLYTGCPPNLGQPWKF